MKLDLASRFCVILFGLPQLLAESVTRQPGYCSNYGNCGKKSVFGKSLPCVNNTRAVEPAQNSLEILYKVCGVDFDVRNGICCSHDQLLDLESNLKKVDPLISSCPACHQNFYDFFCKMACSPDQSTFVEIMKTEKAIDTHSDIVSESAVYMHPEYASEFYDSCKYLEFTATNGYAMDLIGGGAQNYSQFLKFLGDEKPLLGGSPYQINFVYEVPESPGSGLVLASGHMRRCDDPKFKCACSDCPHSCPVLPEFRGFNRSCKILGMQCFTFAVTVIWLCIIVTVGLYHVHLSRSKQHELDSISRILDHEDSDSGSEGEDLITEPSKVFKNAWVSYSFIELRTRYGQLRYSLLKRAEVSFENWALICASHPWKVILVSFIFVLLSSSGLSHLELEKDPIKLWVSPSEQALINKEYFEANFGEWYRVEQIFVSSANDSEPVLSWDIIKWWFEKEQELYQLEDEEGNKLLLEDFCFKPMETTCAIESFTQYFQGNLQYLSEQNWRNELKSCANSPVNCLPSFQQPLKPSLLFSEDDVLNAKAFVVTLLVNNSSKDEHYTQTVKRYEEALKKWITKISSEQSDVRVSFSTEISLEQELNQASKTDTKVIVLSYFIMFLYVSIALGGKIPVSLKRRNFVLTRFQLGLAGILIIVMSVTSSAGLCSYFGIKSTLIIAEVIPFLVLAIGVDNIFLIVHEMKLNTEFSTSQPQRERLPLEKRLSMSVGRIGPSCFASFILQTSMFILASIVKMPAVRNFAIYSAGAVTVNYILQMTMFLSLLALDQKRLEEGRLDLAPWIHANNQIRLGSTEGDHFEFNFTRFFSLSYAPWLLKSSNRGKILSIFLVWLGISLGSLPKIELGLDQRLALPSNSYLLDYFNSVYKYLNVGPPVFFVVKDLDVTQRENQQLLCGKYSTCKEFSVANVLEQEHKRSDFSYISEPASNWLDTFLNWLNPDLDQCCRFKKSAIGEEFCSPFAPPRQCVSCYSDHEPPYSISMEGLPTGMEFMKYFSQWITEPSDPCPLGGKAPYGTSVNFNSTDIKSSYLRTSHKPLRSQMDFITAYRNSLRIVDEIKKKNSATLEIFAFSPFYVFFVQYQNIVFLTLTTLAVAGIIIWILSTILLGSLRMATILTLCVVSTIVNIGGVMAFWKISLNAVSLVNLVICLGLAVEFTIHISKAYLAAKEENSDEEIFQGFMNVDSSTANIKDKRITLASKALMRVGSSVLSGITFTKLIGIMVLAFAQSQIFEVYYFRMWLSLVVIASVHALILLPVLQSMFADV